MVSHWNWLCANGAKFAIYFIRNDPTSERIINDHFHLKNAQHNQLAEQGVSTASTILKVLQIRPTIPTHIKKCRPSVFSRKEG